MQAFEQAANELQNGFHFRFQDELHQQLPGGIYLFKVQSCSIHLGRRGMSFLERDPLFNALFEYIHRQSASVQDFVVESSKIESVSELILGVLAQFKNFELANFVA